MVFHRLGLNIDAATLDPKAASFVGRAKEPDLFLLRLYSRTFVGALATAKCRKSC